VYIKGLVKLPPIIYYTLGTEFVQTCYDNKTGEKVGVGINWLLYHVD